MREYFLYSNDAVPFLEDDDIVFDLDFPENVIRYKETVVLLKQGLTDREIFLEDLNTTYKTCNIDNLKIHLSSIRKSQICAVFVDTMWHRAEIKSKIIEGKIMVKLIDENKVKLVKMENIRYLMRMFK